MFVPAMLKSKRRVPSLNQRLILRSTVNCDGALREFGSPTASPEPGAIGVNVRPDCACAYTLKPILCRIPQCCGALSSQRTSKLAVNLLGRFQRTNSSDSRVSLLPPISCSARSSFGSLLLPRVCWYVHVSLPDQCFDRRFSTSTSKPFERA